MVQMDEEQVVVSVQPQQPKTVQRLFGWVEGMQLFGGPQPRCDGLAIRLGQVHQVQAEGSAVVMELWALVLRAELTAHDLVTVDEGVQAMFQGGG